MESMSYSPSSWEEAMKPISEWTGLQRLWIRVFMSILILINITLSNPAPTRHMNFYMAGSEACHFWPWPYSIPLFLGPTRNALLSGNVETNKLFGSGQESCEAVESYVRPGSWTNWMMRIGLVAGPSCW